MLKPGFVADNEAALAQLAARTGRCAAVVGFVDADRDLYNAAAVCADGGSLGTYRKRLLPNYAVFDEARYFTPGDETDPLELYVIGGVKVGIRICEDIWSPVRPARRAGRRRRRAEHQHQRLAVPPSARPPYRERMLATRAADSHCALVYVNQVGGQDELVFDGCSLVFDDEGTLLARGTQFVEDLLIVDVPIPPVYRKRLLDPRGRTTQALAADGRGVDRAGASSTERLDNTMRRRCSTPIAELYDALVLGTRDYCAKNGFTDVVIGLSGGIDSTIVAVHRRRRARRRPRARRVDAVAVLVATTPSPTPRCSPPTSASTTARSRSSRRSRPTSTCSAPSFDGRDPGLTYENIQSRCRGQMLMALSNEFGWMVLTTGNKSEMAVGYFTIYGDSVGGYAVIKDVLKTRVYDLCRYVNDRAGREIDPRERDHQAAVGRAAPRPARRPEPAAVRGARPDPRAVRRGRPHAPARSSSSATTSRRAPHHPPRRHRRVQAPAVPARRAGDDEGVRQGPPPADHQRLPRLSHRGRRRPHRPVGGASTPRRRRLQPTSQRVSRWRRSRRGRRARSSGSS